MAAATASAEQIRPNSAPQWDFLASPADIAVMGGAAGPGKTYGLLMEAARHIENPDYGAVLFRRTYREITSEGGMWDESMNIYPQLGGDPREGELDWRFPSGARISFAHMQHEKNRLDWKGSQIALIGFDQLEEFSAPQFWYMLSRNRTDSGIAPYIRATVNPDPDSWVAEFLAWWIDQETGYPIEERSGVLRWFMRLPDGTVRWADTPDELPDLGPGGRPKSVTFIPAKLDDNPDRDPFYKTNLLALPLVERERLLGGNWKVRPATGKVFNRGWFEVVDAPPARVRRRVRGWDVGATKGDGSHTAGVKMSIGIGGALYIEDAARGQWDAGERDRTIKNTASQDGVPTIITVPRDPGAAGKAQIRAWSQLLAGHTVHAMPTSGDKLTRSGPFASYCEHNEVFIVRGDWNEAYLAELHAFEGKDPADQVDASADAFTALAGARASVPRSSTRTMTTL